MGATEVGYLAIDFFFFLFFFSPLECCSGISLLGLCLSLVYLSLGSIAQLSWTCCKRQYGRSSSQNSNNRSWSRQISGSSRLWSSCSPSVTILSVYCVMLQSAASYRALLARGDKGQHKVSIGMCEPTRLLLLELDAFPLIHRSRIRPTWLLSKSHILGKWLNFLFGNLVLSLRAEDNEPLVCLHTPPALPHTFSICWPMSTEFVRGLNVFKLWNLGKFCKKRVLY